MFLRVKYSQRERLKPHLFIGEGCDKLWSHYRKADRCLGDKWFVTSHRCCFSNPCVPVLAKAKKNQCYSSETRRTGVSELMGSLQWRFTELKGQKFSVVREFRPRLSSLHSRPIAVCQRQKDGGREGWGEKRSRGREGDGWGAQMREMIAGGKAEVKAWPSLPCHGNNKQSSSCRRHVQKERDEGKRKRKNGRVEGEGGRAEGIRWHGGWGLCGVQVFASFVHTSFAKKKKQKKNRDEERNKLRYLKTSIENSMKDFLNVPLRNTFHCIRQNVYMSIVTEAQWNNYLYRYKEKEWAQKWGGVVAQRCLVLPQITIYRPA